MRKKFVKFDFSCSYFNLALVTELCSLDFTSLKHFFLAITGIDMLLLPTLTVSLYLVNAPTESLGCYGTQHQDPKGSRESTWQCYKSLAP